MFPGALKVAAQREQMLAALRRHGRDLLCLSCFELCLSLRDLRQPFVPTPFELAGNEPVVRVDGVELAMSPCGLEACLLERELQLPVLGMVVVRMLLDRGNAASMPIGRSRARTSSATASSTRSEPNEMHAPEPWLIAAPRQW